MLRGINIFTIYFSINTIHNLENTLSDTNELKWTLNNNSDSGSLSFVERAFLTQDGKDLKAKDVVVYDASEGEPQAYPDDYIVLLKNYKKSFDRGKVDPLKKQDVLAIKTDKGVNYIPLSEAKSFASKLYSLAISIENQNEGD